MDAKWKAFQARFDEINKLMINSISKQMQPAAADDPRCAELVPPTCPLDTNITESGIAG